MRNGVSEIFKSDRGSQSNPGDWLDQLEASGCPISMDVRGRRHDDVFVKRLWRSEKSDDIHLHAHRDSPEARERLDD